MPSASGIIGIMSDVERHHAAKSAIGGGIPVHDAQNRILSCGNDIQEAEQLSQVGSVKGRD